MTTFLRSLELLVAAAILIIVWALRPSAEDANMAFSDPSDSAPKVVTAPELKVTERIGELTGTDCFSASTTLMDLTLEPSIDELVAEAGGTGNWLEVNSRFVGSLDEAATALGGELIAQDDGSAWLLVPSGDYPYGQELARSITPRGEDVWFIVDQIRSCRDPAWMHDATP